MIFLLILLVVAIGGDFLATRALLHEKEKTARLTAAATKMQLKDGDDVISYLEASSEIHPQAAKLLKQLKSLPAHGESTVPQEGSIALARVPDVAQALIDKLQAEAAQYEAQKPVPEPAWTHDTNVRMTPKERWDMFIKDVKREEWEEDMIEVVRHWVVDKGETLTLAEQAMVLDLFEDSDSRREVRELFVTKKDEEKKAS